jgi:hypothetical protein
MENIAYLETNTGTIENETIKSIAKIACIIFNEKPNRKCKR